MRSVPIKVRIFPCRAAGLISAWARKRSPARSAITCHAIGSRMCWPARGGWTGRLRRIQLAEHQEENALEKHDSRKKEQCINRGRDRVSLKKRYQSSREQSCS